MGLPIVATQGMGVRTTFHPVTQGNSSTAGTMGLQGRQVVSLRKEWDRPVLKDNVPFIIRRGHRILRREDRLCRRSK